MKSVSRFSYRLGQTEASKVDVYLEPLSVARGKKEEGKKCAIKYVKRRQ